MTRVLRWAALCAAVIVQFGCDDFGSGVYLLGSCAETPSYQCTEIRMNQNIQGEHRMLLHHAEEARCLSGGGFYHPDELCSGMETAQRACVKQTDEFVFDTDLVFTRSLLYLAGYSSADSFQTEKDACESTGGEFRDSNYVPPGSG